MRNSNSLIPQVTTVALIAFAMRWLFGAKGSSIPKVRDSKFVYGIKWQWRAVGVSGAVFSIVISIWSWHDLHRPDLPILILAGCFVALGIYIGSGSVTTNQTGIAKKTLWGTSHFEWGDIDEVRLHKKQGGAIELCRAQQRLTIDCRFIAFEHLLAEIIEQTQLQPIELR